MAALGAIGVDTVARVIANDVRGFAAGLRTPTAGATVVRGFRDMEGPVASQAVTDLDSYSRVLGSIADQTSLPAGLRDAMTGAREALGAARGPMKTVLRATHGQVDGAASVPKATAALDAAAAALDGVAAHPAAAGVSHAFPAEASQTQRYFERAAYRIDAPRAASQGSASATGARSFDDFQRQFEAEQAANAAKAATARAEMNDIREQARRLAGLYDEPAAQATATAHDAQAGATEDSLGLLARDAARELSKAGRSLLDRWVRS